MYKHYIRANEAGIIIHGFSDAFEQPSESDVLIAENEERHFHLVFAESLVNERGQHCFRWNGEIVERSQQELDDEWAERPPDPPTELDLLRLAIAELAEAQEMDKTEIQLALAEIADLLVGGEV